MCVYREMQLSCRSLALKTHEVKYLPQFPQKIEMPKLNGVIET